MTQPVQEPDPLRPMLDTVEVELERRLEEACSMQGVAEESTGELMRLEETLLEAAQVAKQAVSLRRRMRTDTEVKGEVSLADGPIPVSPPAAIPEAGVRELRDSKGVEWRIWAVTAEQMHASRAGGEHLGEYKDGWLTFEAVSGDERRRLPHYPSDWCEITDEMLERLLDRAERVRRPKRNGEAKEGGTVA